MFKLVKEEVMNPSLALQKYELLIIVEVTPTDTQILKVQTAFFGIKDRYCIGSGLDKLFCSIIRFKVYIILFR